MIDFFSNLHIRLQRKIRAIFSAVSGKGRIHVRFYVALDYLCVWCANIVLPLWLRVNNARSGLKANNSEGERVIVSLTTFPKRIGRVWLVIESMMRQSVKPDEIHLWLSKEQVSGERDLPGSLKREMNKGLRVHFVKGDIRSHKKYYYILQTNPDDIIVTVDDDLFYKSNAIKTLLDYHRKYPECVIANYARKIRSDNGELLPYDTWEQYDAECVDGQMFFGSGGGTLFPPHVLHQDATRLDAILECCPTADDIWLNATTRLNGKKVVKTDSSKVYLPVWNRGDVALSDRENAGGDGNDRQIKLVRDYMINEYGVDPFSMDRL